MGKGTFSFFRLYFFFLFVDFGFLAVMISLIEGRCKKEATILRVPSGTFKVEFIILKVLRSPSGHAMQITVTECLFYRCPCIYSVHRRQIASFTF